ncbi:MAG TPA: glycosyltransferase family 39 protein [Candidatus Eisenbacteria bacterium]|nr:glycosyltransferase family 39 protein [Candidatus Eisenbacteria bacterium]
MRARAADLACLAALLAALLAWPLHDPGIWSRGEAREGLVVRDIVANGSWVIARRDGALASKPPFFHWIAAAAGEVVGPTDAVVRLPSALGAFAMLAATLVLGEAIGGRRVGLIGAAVLASVAYFWRSAIEARVDMVFAAAITVFVAALYLRDRRGTLAPAIVGTLAVVAASLTKGPAGAVLALGIAIAYLAAERRLGQLAALWPWPLATAALIAIGGWYVAAYRIAGREFLDVQLFHENVNRMVGLGAFGRHGSRSTHLPRAFAAHLLPWNLVLVWSARRWWRGEREDAAGHLLHAWWMVVVGFFALASRTRGVYLLPAYPAIALLVARALAPVRARWLLPAVVVLSLVMIASEQRSRLGEARRDVLVPFADRIAPRVADAAHLVAAPTLLENDALVLRYRLARSIRREPMVCERDTLVIAPAPSLHRATALGLRVVDAAGEGDRRIALLECPPG